MSIFNSVKSFFGSPPDSSGREEAGTGQLPSPAPTKAPNKPVALPSFKTQIARAASALQRGDRKLANTDITNYRTSADTRTVVRDFAASSPDLAATTSSYLRTGIPDKYTVIARDMDGAINVKATQLAQEVLRYVTFLSDPSLGYNPTTDLQSLSESLAKELLFYGSMGLELALDKQRRPVYLNPVSVTKIQFKEEDGGVYPVQILGGEERKLDIATFFYVSLDQDLLTAYSTSYFEAAVQSVIADAQFLNDLRKSMQRVIQPRMVATIIEDKVRNSLAPEIANDPVKLGAFYSELIGNLQTMMTGLNPEDALVSFDSVTFSMMKAEGAGNIAETLSTVQKLLESKLAAGAKTMPAVLGRDSTGNAATTSTMLFLKNAGIVRKKLNTIYSRALTQAVRLQGEDVYVEFEYADLDLRPESELEAFKAMKQSRVLMLLSLGLISDEEASVQLTGNLPRTGNKPLAGTMFMSSTGAANANPNATSTTSNMGGAPDPLKPSTPAQPKGK